MRSSGLLIFIGSLLLSAAHAQAGISYTRDQLDSIRWEYTYDVKNDLLTTPIEEFSIYFNHGQYQDLQVTSPLSGWSEIAINPDIILGSPQPGFYDALTLGSGIAPGANQGGFSVSFDWLGIGLPGNQAFDLLDPTTFETIGFGETQLTSVPIVPEPSAVLLMATGLLPLTGRLRRKR